MLLGSAALSQRPLLHDLNHNRNSTLAVGTKCRMPCSSLVPTAGLDTDRMSILVSVAGSSYPQTSSPEFLPVDFAVLCARRVHPDTFHCMAAEVLLRQVERRILVVKRPCSGRANSKRGGLRSVRYVCRCYPKGRNADSATLLAITG